MGKYRKYTAETKVRIVLEILRGDKSMAQASRDYGVKSSLLYRWRDQFLEGAKQSFAYGQAAEQKRQADKVAELERLVGKLTMQLEIAKKPLIMSALYRQKARASADARPSVSGIDQLCCPGIAAQQLLRQSHGPR